MVDESQPFLYIENMFDNIHKKILKFILNNSYSSERSLIRSLVILWALCICNYIFLLIGKSDLIMTILQCYNVIFYSFMGLITLLALGYKRYKKNEDIF